MLTLTRAFRRRNDKREAYSDRTLRFLQCIISLDAFSPSIKPDTISMIQFDAEIEWHERHRFLKWEVPLAIAPTGDMA